MKTDEQIQKNVQDELRYEPLLHAAQIGVAVKQGVVTLTGEVDNYLMKIATERAAKRVQGVKVVVQEVGVKPIFGQPHTDEQIAQSIVSSFEWHSAVPAEKIRVKVQSGWVTLEGQVDWNYQRQAAERSVESLLGVKGVTNLITVHPVLLAKDVKSSIVDAFKRSAALEAQQITVETIGSKVRLHGKVHSWSERREAENTAWAAPGVLMVEDELVVTA
ncbi:BON domain-containing protein [Spirosoma litoris]